MVGLGTLEVAVGGVAHLQRSVSELGITVLPFLWKDEKRLFEVMDGPLGKELEKGCGLPVIIIGFLGHGVPACN